MGNAVELTRADHSAGAFRQAACRCDDADAARRMLALAMVREGASRVDAARLCGMDRQTLRDWVHRYNEAGLAGLHDHKLTRRGPKPRLSPDQKQALAQMVRHGPDRAEHGVVRWRRIDLVRVIQTQFGVTLGERAVGSILRGLGFRRLSARPQHPQQDIEAMQAYKKTFPNWSRPWSPSMRATSRSNFGLKMKRGLVSKAA